MSISPLQAKVRAVRLIVADYGQALLSFSLRPYAAAHHRDGTFNHGLPDCHFFLPSSAVNYVKTSGLGAGHVSYAAPRNEVRCNILTRTAGQRKTWTIPAELRKRLGHANVS